MKKIKMLLASWLAVLLLVSGAAFAASVTINHGGGTLYGTLSAAGMSVNQNGTITINITENLTGGSCTNNPPTISVPSPPTSAVVGQAVTATFTATDGDGGSQVTVTPSRGTISQNTWSWTPTSTGSFLVTLTANDGQNCNNIATLSWTINVTTSGGVNPPPGAITLPYGQWMKGYTLPANGTLYFQTTLSSACQTKVNQFRISVTGYAAGSNADMLVRKSSGGTVSWPTYNDYITRLGNPPVYNAGQKSDQSGYFWNFASTYESEVNIIPGTVPGGQADTYYILLYNNSATKTSVDMFANCY